VEVLFFPQSYAQVGLQIVEDAIVVVKGRVDAREDTVRIIGSELSLPDLTKGMDGPLRLLMSQDQCSPPVIENLKEILRSHPGPTSVEIELNFGQRLRTALPEYGVTPSQALMGDIKALLGTRSIVG
ncbi:MAG TPA: hypothetical protein VMB79_15010, partial [Jatrophihabitans sp.]|nr:hypothetical protein [Jatrophihabitans sp.]